MRLIVVESPYAGDVEANVAYARKCVRDAVLRGDSPIASHLLLTQPGILKDNDPDERALGIEAGLAWLNVAYAAVVYIDRGISLGMRAGIAAAERVGIPVEYRAFDGREHSVIVPPPSERGAPKSAPDVVTA